MNQFNTSLRIKSWDSCPYCPTWFSITQELITADHIRHLWPLQEAHKSHTVQHIWLMYDRNLIRKETKIILVNIKLHWRSWICWHMYIHNIHGIELPLFSKGVIFILLFYIAFILKSYKVLCNAIAKCITHGTQTPIIVHDRYMIGNCTCHWERVVPHNVFLLPCSFAVLFIFYILGHRYCPRPDNPIWQNSAHLRVEV